MNTTKRPVMRDVAKRAGVSVQTVSRVINAHPSVSDSVRRRVQQVIEECGYQPNAAARALVSGRSGVIGLVTSQSDLYGPRTLRCALEDAAQRSGFVTSAVGASDDDPGSVTTAIDSLLRAGVDGVIVAVGPRMPIQSGLRGPMVPLVEVRAEPSGLVSTIGMDQANAAAMATRHLIALGHARIAHVSGPDDSGEAHARRRGWLQAMREAHLPCEPAYVGDWSPSSGYRIGRVLATRPTITGVVIANDQMAIGVLRALHEAGRRVPEDVSVVGFDDIAEAAFVIPPLTTVHQDFAATAREALVMLTATMAGHESQAASIIHPNLIVRASTAPPSESRSTP